MADNRNKYDYYAYIVFDEKDRKWGRWLRRKLSSYHLPHADSDTLKRDSGQCIPILHHTEIFRNDGEDIGSGIARSKYLIVICSSNALRKDAPIDEVIRRFRGSGADPSQIIPFIVDADSKPEDNCFPAELKRLCGIKTILGANIYDSGKDNAFLKVVAHMHGLKLEELESEESRRKKRTVRYIIAGSAVLLAILCTAEYRILDYYMPKTVYYSDYEERYGVPEGIDEMSEREAALTEAHYAITSSRGKVRTLRHENAGGELIPSDKEPMSDRPEQISYSYSDDGELAKAVWSDERDNVLLYLEYINRRTIDVYAGEAEGIHGRGAYMRTDPSVIDKEKIAALKPHSDEGGEIIRYLIDYDENGCMTELRYASSEVYNTAASDENGIDGLRFVRDRDGRIKEVICLVNTSSRRNAVYGEDYEPVAVMVVAK